MNLAVDSLSCYYSSDEPEETHDISEYVNADARLDPVGDDLPVTCVNKLQCMRAELHSDKMRPREVLGKEEPRLRLTQELKENWEIPKEIASLAIHPTVKDILPLLVKLYQEDPFFLEIWCNTERHGRFERRKNLLWMQNYTQHKVVCIPKGHHEGRSV